MLDWGNLEYFISCANHGTLSGCAKEMGVNHSTVSRKIEKLEKDLIQDRKDKQIPAIASALMHSEFYKSKVQSQNSVNQNWKNKMDSV